jgi:hypothetical protein
MAPRYTGVKIYNTLYSCQTKSGLKFQDVRVFRGMTVRSDHYLVNAKILFLYGQNNTTESRENITDGASELLQSPLYNI